MYRPRHAKSQHWRRRLLMAATIAGGTLLALAPAALADASKYGWG